MPPMTGSRGYRAHRERTARGLNALLRPVESLLLKLRIGPDALNWAGLILSAASGVLIATGFLALGGAALFLGGMADILDGRLARRLERVSPFGAFIDSTLDRFGESFVYLGLLFYLQERGVSGFWPAFALAGALIVSYARARGESVGVVCDAGLMQRGERLSLIIGACWIVPLLGRAARVDEVRIMEGFAAVLGLATWLSAVVRAWTIAVRLRRK